MLRAIPLGYREGDVATVTRRDSCLSMVRHQTLAQAQSTPGYGKRRAQVNTDTLALRGVHRAGGATRGDPM